MRTQTRDVLEGGLYAGLIGYATVIVVMAFMNVILGRSPFYTAALFGSALFYGLKDPAALVVAAGPVLAYNGAHMLAFLALGLGASWLVALAERHPTAQYVFLIVLIFIGFHVFGALLLFAEPLLGAAGWWQLGIGTLAAAFAMGWYLWRAHPLLQRELHDLPMGATAEQSEVGSKPTLGERLTAQLERRHWTPLDAGRAAEAVARHYQVAAGKWQVWHRRLDGRIDVYRVSRRESEVSVYDSSQEGRARDVASALNDVQGQSEAVGTR